MMAVRRARSPFAKQPNPLGWAFLEPATRETVGTQVDVGSCELLPKQKSVWGPTPASRAGEALISHIKCLLYFHHLKITDA